MARLNPPTPSAMSDAQRAVHDRIASGPRGGTRGPLALWLWRPELAERAQHLGRYCRYETSLPPRLSELAILVTARAWSAEYEWQAHKAIALEAGLAPQVVDAIRDGREPPFTDDTERVVYRFSRALVLERRVADADYAAARERLGDEGLVDLVGVLGYYGLVSMTLNAFEVDPPEGCAPEMG